MPDIDYLQLAALLSPILLIQLGLAIFALVDLSRRSQVRGKKFVWAFLLVLSIFALPTGLIVSGLYLTWGRHVEVDGDQQDDQD